MPVSDTNQAAQDACFTAIAAIGKLLEEPGNIPAANVPAFAKAMKDLAEARAWLSSPAHEH